MSLQELIIYLVMTPLLMILEYLIIYLIVRWQSNKTHAKLNVMSQQMQDMQRQLDRVENKMMTYQEIQD